MPRNITTPQYNPRDFQKSDVLAQTNQIKYDCFFCMAYKNTKNFFSRSKSRNSNPGHVFLDFIVLFNIAVEKFGKKNNLVKLKLSKEIVLSPEYVNFGSKF